MYIFRALPCAAWLRGKVKQGMGKMTLRMVPSLEVKASRTKGPAGLGWLGFLLSSPVPGQQTIIESMEENYYKAL